MNKINRVIFVDSTISYQELTPYLKLTDLVLPAIRRGDIIKLVKTQQDLKYIVIIDGVFDQEGSITHKEILWGLSQQIYIIGLSSLGALRAYELKNFGVIGYGKIYEKYCANVIDGDDEVAIVYYPHDPQNKTLAFINIRLTFEKINFFDQNVLMKIRKKHFKERTWNSLQKILSNEIYLLLKEHYIDYKKEDVLSFFSDKMQIKKIKDPNVFIHNIYFTRKISYYGFENTIKYLKNKLESCSGSDNSFLMEYSTQETKKIAMYILRYIELHDCYIDIVVYILIKLKHYHYSEKTIKIFSEKIRKEQHLIYSKSLNNYLILKNIDNSYLRKIYEGLLKLEKYLIA